MKRLLALSIIVASVIVGITIVGFFVVGNSKSKTGEDLTYKIIPSDENQKTNPSYEDLASLGSNKISATDDSKGSVILDPKNDNLTEQIAHQIASKIIGTNDKNSLLGNLKNNDSDLVNQISKITDRAINQASDGSQIDKLETIVNIKDLNVSENSSKIARDRYILTMNGILNVNLPALLQEFKNLSVHDFGKVEVLFNNLIKKLYLVEVPKDLISFHSKEISLLSGIRNGISEIKKSESDPAKILVLIQSIDSLNRQFIDLNKNNPNL